MILSTNSLLVLKGDDKSMFIVKRKVKQILVRFISKHENNIYILLSYLENIRIEKCNV